MAKANAHPTAAPTKHASIHFSDYRPGKPSPFVFDIMAIDDGGNCIHGAATMPSDRAVQAALHILKIAAGFEGLTDEQRGELRTLAAMEAAFGGHVEGCHRDAERITARSR